MHYVQTTDLIVGRIAWRIGCLRRSVGGATLVILKAYIENQDPWPFRHFTDSITRSMESAN